MLRKTCFALATILIASLVYCGQPSFYSNLALCRAVQDSNSAQVLHLLKKGAEINAVDRRGGTALCYAVQQGNIPLVRLLLKHGASVNASAIPILSLAMAGTGPEGAKTKTGVLKLLRILTKHGALINAKASVTTPPPLIMACVLGNVDAAAFLVKYAIASESLTFGDFNRLVSELSGRKLPMFTLPDSMTIASAHFCTWMSKLTKSPPILDLAIDEIRQLKQGCQADGGKAVRELGLSYTPVRAALEEEISSLKRN
jgi:ankyrin repeat protein